VFVGLSRAPAAAYPAVATRSAGRSSFVVGGRSIYGGTCALLKNLLPRFGVTTRFVDLCKHDDVAHACALLRVAQESFARSQRPASAGCDRAREWCPAGGG
jgi:hypothetical protein